MTEDILGVKECRALIFALTEYILAGVNEISHTISTNNGWEFTVTVKVTKRGILIEDEEADE